MSIRYTGKKFYSCNDEEYSDEDPEQCAYDYLLYLEEGDVCVVMEGEVFAFESEEDLILLGIGRVREYARYTLVGDWVKEVKQ